MFFSTIEDAGKPAVHAELKGARVLLTGVSARHGIDVARAFADTGCRLILQAEEASPEVAAIAEVLAKSTAEMRLTTAPIRQGEEAVRCAQSAAQAFSGLEVVVNLVEIAPGDLQGLDSVAAIEDLIAARLTPATLITRVAANRMRLTHTEGLVLNVVLMPEPANDRERALISLARAAIAALTRGEAQQWAGESIRINAIAPRSGVEGDATTGACLASEADIAALAVHLASRRGRTLSGLVFDASGVAKRVCG